MQAIGSREGVEAEEVEEVKDEKKKTKTSIKNE
jgi:hypothetical protein